MNPLNAVLASMALKSMTEAPKEPEKPKPKKSSDDIFQEMLEKEIKRRGR